jgi:hypothetical protein
MNPNVAIRPYGKISINKMPFAKPAAIVFPSSEFSRAARHIEQP